MSRILTIDNTVFKMESLPIHHDESGREIEGIPPGDKLRYWVLDCRDPDDIDMKCMPMYHWETYSSSALKVEFGHFGGNDSSSLRPLEDKGKNIWQSEHSIIMPIDWHVMVGFYGEGTLQPIALKELNDRNFETLLMNPMEPPRDIFEKDYYIVRVTELHGSINWSFPMLEKGQILAVPLSDNENPQCAWMTPDTGRIPNEMTVGEILGV